MTKETHSLRPVVPPPVAALLAVLVLAAPAYVVHRQGREAASIRARGEDLRTVSAAFRQYLTTTPDHRAPAMATPAKTLAIAPDAVERVIGPDARAAYDRLQGAGADGALFYLGYMLEDDVDVNVFVGYVESHPDGQPFDEVLQLPQPRIDPRTGEPSRTGVLRTRLLENQPEDGAWKEWYTDASQIPVFIAPTPREGPQGFHVAFLDGSVAFYPFARGNNWPMTRNMIGKLKTLRTPPPSATQ